MFRQHSSEDLPMTPEPPESAMLAVVILLSALFGAAWLIDALVQSLK
jgi:hypothetical protein